METHAADVDEAIAALHNSDVAILVADSGQRWTDTDAMRFAAAVEARGGCAALAKLYLSSNDIGPVGVSCLARVFELLPNLDTVGLSGNQIADAGAESARTVHTIIAITCHDG